MATPYTNALIPQVVRKSVGTSAVAISSNNQLVYSFVIQNPSNATGLLFVGDSSIDSTACITLGAGDSLNFDFINSPSGALSYDLAGVYLRSNVATIKAKILKIVKGDRL